MMHVSFSQKLKIFLASLSLVQASCTPWGGAPRNKPPILIIAVESLGFESASCLEPEGVTEGTTVSDDGWRDLCRSSLRFTHLYVPSTLSQSNLASLLTGLDASEHRVFHNGNEGIPPPIVTLAEKSLQGGYRTAFFSGGPPLLAKSGFQQGYEFFDDEFHQTPGVYTKAADLLPRALAWMSEQSQPTMTTIFLADLQFPFVQTFSKEGKERERNSTGQKEELSEALGFFFKQLKKMKMWDPAYIVVLGLNGEAPMNRKSFLWRENLFRENVHVPLFIKTPNLKEARSMDFLISVKNIGLLLRESIEQSRSVADYVLQKLEEWKETPLTHIEVRSDWARWWMGRPPLLSLRTAEYLVIPQKRWQIYHTLVDKSEGISLTEPQIDREKMRWMKSRLEQSHDLQTEPSEIYDFIKAFRTVKMTGTALVAKDLFRIEKDSFSESIYWDDVLRRNDWEKLSASPVPLHRYVAARHLQTSVAVTITGACERFFMEKLTESLSRKCRDSIFLSLLDWEQHRGESDAVTWEKNFMRQFRMYMQSKQMAYDNIYLELNWDVNVFPMLGPSLTELYLALPEKAFLRKKVESYQIPLTVGFPSAVSSL